MHLLQLQPSIVIGTEKFKVMEKTQDTEKSVSFYA